jgi:hypothetical protein
MAQTPARAYGRLEMDYVAYEKPHVFRCWVREFGVDAGVGTFVTADTPASLDALATALSGIIKGLYNTDSALAWGSWRGLKTVSLLTGAGVPVVEGTITPGTGTFDTQPNPAQAVAQTTFSFRDGDSKIAKLVFLGSVYYGPKPFFYSGLGGSFAALVNYMLTTTRVVSRGNDVMVGLIDVTFDTNDGLTRAYRR